ncbi:MAG: hypothetical protein ACOX19_05665 [Fermentimonas sp.]|jgi:hypothetical protein
MKNIKYKNIDFSMIHLNIGDKHGGILVDMDKLPKNVYNEAQRLLIDGYEPDIEQGAVTYDNRIDKADKELLQKLIELMTERLNLCSLRRNEAFIIVYENLINRANKRLIDLEKPRKRTLPVELQTDMAKQILQKAIGMGFMNEDFSFNGSRYQQAYFAELASNKLGLTEMRRIHGKIVPFVSWKPFEKLWGCKHLAQTNRENKEYIGKVEKQDEIDSIFI